MSQVVISEIAREDIERLTNFLSDNNAKPQAKGILVLLQEAFAKVGDLPNLGKIYLSVDATVGEKVREYKFRYGNGGYQFLYHYDDVQAVVVILTIKHYRENSYS